MALQLGKPKMPASKPRKDEERETRQATIEDADKTEGKLSLRKVSRRTWMICNRVSADSRCRLATRAVATVSVESVSDFATYWHATRCRNIVGIGG
jgi:hypothetical protein